MLIRQSRLFSNLSSLRELSGLYENEIKQQFSVFQHKYETFLESQKKEICYLGRELTDAQIERAKLLSEEILQLNPLEIRALHQVLAEKKRRSFNYKPDNSMAFDDKDTQLRSQKFWPPNHPVNVELQEESGQRGVLGLHGYPKAFMDKFLSGELFSVTQVEAPVEVIEEKKPEVVEKTSFNLVLKGFSPEGKVKLIKELKDLLKLGLKEAKDQLESTSKEPLIIAKAISKDTHQAVYDKIKELGGDIEFQ